jgi:hypothetical protein
LRIRVDCALQYDIAVHNYSVEIRQGTPERSGGPRLPVKALSRERGRAHAFLNPSRECEEKTHG